MGLSSSRMEGRPSDCRPNRTRRFLSSLICGSSTSQSSSELEEHAAKSLVSSVENFPPASDESRCSCTASSVRLDSESGSDDTKTEVGASSGSSIDSFEDNFAQHALRNDTEVSNPCKSLSESKESVSHQVKQQYLESVSANSESRTVSVSPEVMNSSSVMQEHPSENQQVRNNENPVEAPSTPASGTLSVISDSALTLQWLGYNSPLVIPTDQDLRTGGLLQVDVVSISSNVLSSSIAEISNREARRNSRRLFWDALLSHSFRRQNNDSPTIVFTTGHADDLGSHDRWLLDLSGDLHYDGVSRESEYFGSRRHRRNERRRQLRSEVISITERIRSGTDEGGRQTAFCASGIHPEGTCSCDSPVMGEESSTFASISRIVMLSEALFEVLDEIHRQPMSLSLSMLSVPAPESVVNLFPIKSHKRSCASETESSDVEQCYICLVEYEEGDKIRVLPCHHEYHMSCVDKWLKEIHGVCPLCRHNVCEGVNLGSTSTAEIPS